MQRIKCSNCNKSLKVPKKMAGKSALCPRCGTRINFVKKPKEVWVELESDSLPPTQTRPRAQQAPPRRAPAGQPAAPVKQAPVAAPQPSGGGGFTRLMVGLVLLGLLGGGGYLAFPDVYRKAYDSIVERFSEKEPEANQYFTSLDLEIEKAAAEKLDELWADYSEQDDYGNPVMENGRMVLTLEGLNQFNRAVDESIDGLISEQVEQDGIGERINLFQQIVAKLSDDRSPLSLTSEITQLAARTRLQDRIQDVAIKSWEQHFKTQSDKIQKLSGIPETKLSSYQELNAELEERTIELIAQLTPDADDAGATEMFNTVRRRLLDKYQYAANANVAAMLNVITNEIENTDKAAEATARLDALFSLYESSVLDFRAYNEDAGAFEATQMNQRTPAATSMVNRRNTQITTAIGTVLRGMQPVQSALGELARLEAAYPRSAQITGFYRNQLTPKPANGTQGATAGTGGAAGGTGGAAGTNTANAGGSAVPMLPVEQSVHAIYVQLAQQYPQLDDAGRPEMRAGRVVLTQDGVNELNRLFGAEIDKVVNQPVSSNQYVRKIFSLKSILERMESETSPLSMISDLAKVSIRVRVQEQIQRSAVDAWEQHYRQQQSLIEGLPNIPLTKLEQYSTLNRLIEDKATELLRTLAPETEESADVEMFNLAQKELEAKLENATARNFDEQFDIIKNELEAEDPNRLRIVRIEKMLSLYSQFISIFKTYDYQTHEFIVRPMNQLTPEQQQRANLKYRKIYNEVYTMVYAIEPASAAIDTLKHLAQAYPAAGAMSAQLMSGLTQKEFAQTLAAAPVDELLRIRNEHAYDQAREFQILAQIVDRLSRATPAQKPQLIQTVRGAYFNEVLMWRQLWTNQPVEWNGRTWTPREITAAKQMFGRIEADLRTVGVMF